MAFDSKVIPWIQKYPCYLHTLDIFYVYLTLNFYSSVTYVIWAFIVSSRHSKQPFCQIWKSGSRYEPLRHIKDIAYFWHWLDIKVIWVIWSLHCYLHAMCRYGAKYEHPPSNIAREVPISIIETDFKYVWPWSLILDWKHWLSSIN